MEKNKPSTPKPVNRPPSQFKKKTCKLCKYAGFEDIDGDCACYCLKTTWRYTKGDEIACEYFKGVENE